MDPVLDKDTANAARAGAAASRRPAATLVEGNIARTLVVFSLPILGSNVLQSINASINTAWIGQLLGPRALTASANANSILFFLLSISFGLSLAATILIGQSFGARDMVQTKRVMGTSALFFSIASAALAALGFVIAPLILRAMQTPADAEPLASAYLRIIFLGVPAIFFFNFMMMALRGAGDSRTPFVFLFISAIFDTGLNPLLIRGLGPLPALGIAGSAWATTFAQWIALGLLVAWLYRKRHPLCLRRADLQYLRIDRAILRSLITKGVPMGLQVVVVSSSMILLISLINKFGSLTVAAYGACFQLWNYIQMPAFAVGSAVSSMAAQNLGAGRWDRVNRIALAGVVYNVLLTGSLVGIVTLFDHAAFSLFLGGNLEAIEIAKHMHLVASWSFILFGVSFVLASIVRANGAVIVPLFIMILAIWGVRLPIAAWLSHTGVDGVLWGFPAGSFASVLLTAAYYRYGGWRQARMLGR